MFDALAFAFGSARRKSIDRTDLRRNAHVHLIMVIRTLLFNCETALSTTESGRPSLYYQWKALQLAITDIVLVNFLLGFIQISPLIGRAIKL